MEVSFKGFKTVEGKCGTCQYSQVIVFDNNDTEVSCNAKRGKVMRRPVVVCDAYQSVNQVTPYGYLQKAAVMIKQYDRNHKPTGQFKWVLPGQPKHPSTDF